MHCSNKIISLVLTLTFIVPVSSPVYADENETCKGAAEKLSGVIVDWYQMVKEFGAEANNPSVMKMYVDYTNNSLRQNLVNKCMKTWERHKDIYTCFSGVRTEIGAGMCMHPDTNNNNWAY